MQFYREPGIIRPLLDISREEIDRYVEENHIPFREDQTNQDIMLRRNYIRLEVMPRLKQINEQAGRNIARMASVAAVDDAFLESETQKRYDRLVAGDKNGVIIALAGYREEPLAMRWRLLRRILEQDFSLKDIEQKHIELLDEFARQAGTGKKLDIKYEVFATISYGRLIICRKTAKIETNSAIFPLLEETVLPDGAVLVYSEATLPEDFPKNESTEQWAAGDALEGAVIRKRLPGDRFRPFGSKKAKKLKDWMIDKKIERNRRDTLWLLAKEGKVLWVPGYGMGEELRITQDTKKIYKISYIEGEIK